MGHTKQKIKVERTQTEITALRIMRKRNFSVMRLMQNQTEEVESYEDINSTLRKELEGIKDVVNKNKVFLKNLQIMPSLKTINKNLSMEVQEQRTIIMDLKLKLKTLKTISRDEGEVVRGCEEQRFVNRKAGRRKYIEMINSKLQVLYVT